MRIAIMQPYFFPYLGYYSLIKETDRFILFDTVQHIRHGWITRNRILKPVEGWQYILVPLQKHGIKTNINEIKIKNSEDWKGKILSQLEHYKKRSPFYKETVSVVESALSIETDSIVSLNKNILVKTCEYFNLPLNIEIYSDMNLAVDEATHPGEWALNISKAVNAKEYVNPVGGIDIFDSSQFDSAAISIRFLANNLGRYNQRRLDFEAGLSIIDVMMFNDIDDIRKLIGDTKYITGS